MAKSEMERAVATHRNTGNRTVGAAGRDTILLLDEGKEFLKQEILITNSSILCVDVETGAAGGSGDEEVFQFGAIAQIFDEIPQAGMDEELFVVAEAVERVKDREVFCLVGVERGGKHHAVRNVAGQDFA